MKGQYCTSCHILLIQYLPTVVPCMQLTGIITMFLLWKDGLVVCILHYCQAHMLLFKSPLGFSGCGRSPNCSLVPKNSLFSICACHVHRTPSPSGFRTASVHSFMTGIYIRYLRNCGRSSKSTSGAAYDLKTPTIFGPERDVENFQFV